MSWYFPQVEGLLTPPQFSLKTFDAWNKIVSRLVLQEKLESLVGVLHVPEEVWWKRRWVVALQLQMGSFRDSDVIIRLGHWLGSSSWWNINAESVNSALFNTEHYSTCGQRSKMEQYSLRNRSISSIKVNAKVIVEQWSGSELLSNRFPTNESEDWLTWTQVSLNKNDKGFIFLLMEVVGRLLGREAVLTKCLPLVSEML